MGIFPNDLHGMQHPFVQTLYAGIGMQTDLHLVTHATYFHLHLGWGFMDKITF